MAETRTQFCGSERVLNYMCGNPIICQEVHRPLSESHPNSKKKEARMTDEAKEAISESIKIETQPRFEDEISAPPKRGEITGYTPSSKRRHVRKIAESMDKLVYPDEDFTGTFITLTYPGQLKPEHLDPEICQQHLEKWWKRLQYAFSDSCWMCWTIELQERGAWHYHGLLYWTKPDNWADRKSWNDRAWAEVVAGKGNLVDEVHQRVGCNMKPIHVADFVVYLSKTGQKVASSETVDELSKLRQRGSEALSDRPQSRGFRWWGIMNRKAWKECRRLPDRFQPVYQDTMDAINDAYWWLWNRWMEEKEIPEDERLDYMPQYAQGRMLNTLIKMLEDHEFRQSFGQFAMDSEVQKELDEVITIQANTAEKCRNAKKSAGGRASGVSLISRDGLGGDIGELEGNVWG